MSGKDQAHEKLWLELDGADELAENIAEEFCSALEDKLIIEDSPKVYYLLGFATGFRTAKTIIREIGDIGKTEAYHNLK